MPADVWSRWRRLGLRALLAATLAATPIVVQARGVGGADGHGSGRGHFDDRAAGRAKATPYPISAGILRANLGHH